MHRPTSTFYAPSPMKTTLATLAILALPTLALAHGTHPATADPATHSLLHLAPAAALLALTVATLAIVKARRKPAKARR
jgi:hypothetical protein